MLSNTQKRKIERTKYNAIVHEQNNEQRTKHSALLAHLTPHTAPHSPYNTQHPPLAAHHTTPTTHHTSHNTQHTTHNTQHRIDNRQQRIHNTQNTSQNREKIQEINDPTNITIIQHNIITNSKHNTLMYILYYPLYSPSRS